MEKLTQSQYNVLNYVSTYIKRESMAPTYDEMCKGLNYTSKSTIHLHIQSLKKKGYITTKGNSARSIRVVNEFSINDVE